MLSPGKHCRHKQTSLLCSSPSKTPLLVFPAQCTRNPEPGVRRPLGSASFETHLGVCWPKSSQGGSHQQ